MVILLAASWLTLFYNVAFFTNVLAQYPVSAANLPFLLSLAVLLFAFTALLLGLMCFRLTLKPILVIMFPLAALAGHFMSRYNIVVDTAMISNVLATDSHEVRDLLSPQLFMTLAVFGLLPAWWVSGLQIRRLPLRQALGGRLALLVGVVSVIALMVGTHGSAYASFFREHKNLRYYANPVTALYSMGKFVADRMEGDVYAERQQIGLDARIPDTDFDRELIVLVLGETARADHFSLNGYSRKTNPLLEKYPVVYFPHMTSCATSTAISLPCMFSLAGEGDFEIDDAARAENLLDVMQHAGVHVLWRDNNSDSKGLAIDVPEQNFHDPAVNPVCDEECRDVGMLAGLDDWIDAQEQGDVVIVLHQMGNHGPSYYKRYPGEFEVFTPVCHTNDLENCTEEEINNAYDNAILYTDYFLAQVIDFLKVYDGSFETAMFYVSDHGESLGEHGLYLHGLPNFMAPEEQRHVPALMWFGENYEIDMPQLLSHSNNRYSHDNYFHTVLSFMEIETELYDPALDIILDAHL